MFLYLVGAVMLELNLLSFAGYHMQAHASDPSNGVILYTMLFSFFVVEYLNFEEVHLYTYDIMAERVGFKLGWGCLVFYPFFYPIGLWAVAELPDPHTPAPLLVAYGLLFLAGWMLARGARTSRSSGSSAIPRRRPSACSSRARSRGTASTCWRAASGGSRGTSIIWAKY